MKPYKAYCTNISQLPLHIQKRSGRVDEEGLSDVMQGLLEMSPHPKQVVGEQPVDVVQARVLYRVVLGLVPMSGCGLDLVLLNRICSQQSFIFLVSIRLS